MTDLGEIEPTALTEFVRTEHEPLKVANERFQRQLRETHEDLTALGIPERDRSGKLLSVQGRLRVLVYRIGRRQKDAVLAIEEYQATEDERFLMDALALLRPDGLLAMENPDRASDGSAG